MRQVFSSPRLENVERVAALLRDADIEVRIVNGRSYKGNRRSAFSFRDNASGPRPSVWVIRSDDQTRARALLREIGLLQNQPSTRSYLGQSDVVFAPAAETPPKGMTRASKVRYTLIGGAVLVIALSWWNRPGSTGTPAQAPAVDVPKPALDMVPPTVEATVYRAPVPRALATAVLADALAGQTGPVCVSIDGGAPAAPLLAELEAGYPDVRPSSACGNETGPPVSLDVTRYRTDGSGQGTVDVVSRGTDATQATVTRTLDVRRDGRDWTFDTED